MKYLSVCIPTYEMNGLGHVFLKHSFDILTTQTFKDFDVVVSDHSTDTSIQDLCDLYKDKLTIHYYRNTNGIGSSSANINNAITHATGTLIKILFQDDFLFHEKSLEDIVQHFDINTDHWLVTGCIHTADGIHFYRPFVPRYNRSMHLGNNTISSPSVLTIKNEGHLLFDEQLIWLMDCEYYKRLHDAFGAPKIIPTVNAVNRTGTHQVSNTLATKTLRKKEFLYVLQKYEHGICFWYYRILKFIKDIIKP